MSDAAEYETVLKWMNKAAINCKSSGRTDAALLWHDAIVYLEAQESEIQALQAERDRYRDALDKIRVKSYYIAEQALKEE